MYQSHFPRPNDLAIPFQSSKKVASKHKIDMVGDLQAAVHVTSEFCEEAYVKQLSQFQQAPTHARNEPKSKNDQENGYIKEHWLGKVNGKEK